MAFKRNEGFRFAFGEPIPGKYTIFIDGQPEDVEKTKHPCEILDISPRGMKMFSYRDIGEHSNKLVQLEVQFVLDVETIKALGDIVWEKGFGDKFQLGLIFDNQPQVEELIVSELKARRRKEVGRR